MVKERTSAADIFRVRTRLDRLDDPRAAARVFGALLLVAVALTVLVATGVLERSGGPPPAPAEPSPRSYV